MARLPLLECQLCIVVLLDLLPALFTLQLKAAHTKQAHAGLHASDQLKGREVNLTSFSSTDLLLLYVGALGMCLESETQPIQGLRGQTRAVQWRTGNALCKDMMTYRMSYWGIQA